eukprot:scaffold580477_cov53-Prasinocladus_malaysianus.AAC.1
MLQMGHRRCHPVGALPRALSVCSACRQPCRPAGPTDLTAPRHHSIGVTEHASSAAEASAHSSGKGTALPALCPA